MDPAWRFESICSINNPLFNFTALVGLVTNLVLFEVTRGR